MPIMKPAKMAASTYLRYLFTKTEKALIDEILRKRNQGYVDYAETAALRRIQDDLQHMVDESWEYVPQMIETRFYGHPGAAEGYANAASIAGSTNSVMMETLVDNLLGEITEAATRAAGTASKLYTIARMDDDELRKAALSSTAYAEALGKGAYYSSKMIEAAIRNHGVTAFVDKAGRNWSLSDYCNMAARTTARQAEVAGVLSKDDHDLYQIVKIGSTCPVCAALEGRVYSKSGTDPNYPPLAMAFGKIDPAGADDLSNTYLNIHPNCLHSLIPFTEAGKTEKQIQKIREFSSPETNPLSQDPRSKAQIEAYREKERNRARLLRDHRQFEEYKAVLGKYAPKTFADFRELRYNNPEKWEYTKGLKNYLSRYPTSDKRYYDIGVSLKEKGIKIGIPLPPVQKRVYILPSTSLRDPYHIMHRMQERHITDDQLRKIVKDADCMFVQWGGQRQRFVSKEGMAVVLKEGDSWLFRTGWLRSDYDEESDKIAEVLKNAGL